MFFPLYYRLCIGIGNGYKIMVGEKIDSTFKNQVFEEVNPYLSQNPWLSVPFFLVNS